MTNAAIMNKNGAEGKSIERPRTLADFEALLRRDRDFTVSLSAKIVNEALLEWNKSNRPVDQVRVQAYKRDQNDGRWLAGETIGMGVFHDSIQIGDGQHRWLAQVASGTEQVYRIRIFTDETEFALFVVTRDCGKIRSLADLFTVLHVTEGTGAAQAFERITNSMQAFYGATPHRLSRQERLDFAEKHAKEIKYALSLPTKQFRAHVLGAVAIAYGKHPKLVGEFIGSVISGADLPAKSPALELSKALPGLNESRSPREKDRAIGVVMRVIHDGIRGKKKTTVQSLLRTDSSPIVAAIAEFAGASVAKAWVERNDRRGGK